VTPGDFLGDLAARLAARPPLVVDFGDESAGFRDAAVLVPIVLRPGAAPTLLFTRRPASMRTHSGQISFPGGRRDDDDPDLEATALRETEEELGIPRPAVRVLGRLGQVPTPSGYVITPVVGVLAPPPEAYQPHVHEVDEAFEIPLEALRSPVAHVDKGTVDRFGQSWRLLEYHVDGRVIWGATARMVSELLDLWP
jgi:8-oxo-dGTP pyrophosphatase MutT (NUDIX family)